MKIVMWADCHVEHSVSSDNVRGLKQSFLLLDVLEGQIDEMETPPDAVLVIGDFFDAFGRIEASLAVVVKERIERIAARGIKFVFITGNHEYQKVKDEFFGKGIVKALFGGKEAEGIYVVDEKARYIRLDDSHVILGLPYRETHEQFERDCLVPKREALGRGEVRLGQDKVIIGWHVGLPFAANWRGDEPADAWINADDDDVQEIFDEADSRRIFLGHYHGPGDCEFVTKDGRHIGTGTYIGSPATRTISESGQNKRVGVWEDSQMSFLSTGLDLDAKKATVEEAVNHLAGLIDLFGEDVLDVAHVHVDLGKEASMDDYNIALQKKASYPGTITVERPNIVKKGLVEPILQKHREDPNSTRMKMEEDIFLFSIRLHYKNASFKTLQDQALDLIVTVGYPTWKKLQRSIRKGGYDNDAAAVIEGAFKTAGLAGSMPDLTMDFCAQAARLAKTEEIAKQLLLSVKRAGT